MLTFGVPDPGVLDVVGGIPVDFMPFDAQLEEPPGTLTPPPRKEGWTVAGFQDVHRHAQDVDIDPREVTVRMPSPAGYTALKLRSWAVRAALHDTKDARDLAVACHWYTESEAVRTELYETERGQRLLMEHDFDQDLAAVALLSRDVATIFSTPVRIELAADLRNADAALLAGRFTTAPQLFLTSDVRRRQALIAALLSAVT
ncbi:hypothetical protein JNE43_08060 [Kocuria rhizophila]|uniref:hypothetical protein n=2 Tax=Kocuria rhizophila TaxID=72000 RepID=UPI001E00746C|nr:hypothetical protein [Kocuria rhizophila]MCC5674763.1 hypothetical protein [Kocuria rhizophila]